jgi:ZIP family zinc transporter
MALGIAIHNLPEGLAVGCGMVSPDASSIGLAAAILLHDAPEGLAVAIPMRMAKMSGHTVLMVTALTGLPTAVGVLAGYALGSVSQSFMDFCTGFAAGAMLVLVLSEMIPDAVRLTGRRAIYALIAGVAAGLGIVLASSCFTNPL